MVRNRHAGTGLEVLTLAQLRSRIAADDLQAPQRATSHHLLRLDRGVLSHTVDFTTHTLTPGQWLWVRPGQVHQWGDLAGVQGTLIVFEAGFLDPSTAAAVPLDDPLAPVVRRPAGDERAGLADAAGHLARSFTTSGRLPQEVRQTVLRHLLAVLVLRLAHVDAQPDRPANAFVRFRDAVERDFARTRRLDDYASALGCSVRTLTRTTRAVAGINAKDFIDRRTILEAKRLLAHSDQTAAQIAARLGFTSATNFGKFFQQRTGRTPITFRTGVRGGQAVSAA